MLLFFVFLPFSCPPSEFLLFVVDFPSLRLALLLFRASFKLATVAVKATISYCSLDGFAHVPACTRDLYLFSAYNMS